jgi:hypothetical protein
MKHPDWFDSYVQMTQLQNRMVKREWQNDIRLCDGCKEERYAPARYQPGTGVFVGFFDDQCWAERLSEVPDAD